MVLGSSYRTSNFSQLTITIRNQVGPDIKISHSPVLILNGTALPSAHLSQSPGFAFGFQQGQDVAFANWALDVADDLTVLLADEFHLHLGTLTLGTGAAKDLDDASQNDGLIHDFSGILTEHTCGH